MPWLGTCISDPCVFLHLNMAIPHNIIPSYLFFTTFDHPEGLRTPEVVLCGPHWCLAALEWPWILMGSSVMHIWLLPVIIQNSGRLMNVASWVTCVFPQRFPLCCLQSGEQHMLRNRWCFLQGMTITSTRQYQKVCACIKQRESSIKRVQVLNWCICSPDVSPAERDGWWGTMTSTLSTLENTFPKCLQRHSKEKRTRLVWPLFWLDSWYQNRGCHTQVT